MTAEERMAYFQGEKRRSTAYYTTSKEKTSDNIFLKIKFFMAVLLFIAFLSLDYTGFKIQGIGSSEIIRWVTADSEFPDFAEEYLSGKLFF